MAGWIFLHNTLFSLEVFKKFWFKRLLFFKQNKFFIRFHRRRNFGSGFSTFIGSAALLLFGTVIQLYTWWVITHKDTRKLLVYLSASNIVFQSFFGSLVKNCAVSLFLKRLVYVLVSKWNFFINVYTRCDIILHACKIFTVFSTVYILFYVCLANIFNDNKLYLLICSNVTNQS